MAANNGQFNFLIITTDEERYPPTYEDASIQQFRQEYLPGISALRENSLEMHRHYTASTACSPSRTSIYTGHYPSLHGVTQTSGMPKSGTTRICSIWTLTPYPPWATIFAPVAIAPFTAANGICRTRTSFCPAV